MSDKMNIFNVLKESGTSRFIKSLTPDAMVPSITRAVEIFEQDGGDEGNKVRKEVFHTPRIVSIGSHFAFTVPEKRPFYRPLIKSTFGHRDLGLKMDERLEKLLSGEVVYRDSEKGIFPYSMAYAGFQFGQFAGQLGDGRVVNLFELRDPKGKLQTLQLKGSGLTPFSRFADGKAVLRSSIREFIICEALYQIGIPSTRALQLTSLPKTRATRGMSFEPTAVVCRVAPSWIRLGNFDLFRWKPNLEGLLKLVNFTIDEVFEQGKDFPKEVDVNVFKKDYFPDEGAEYRQSDDVQGVTKYDLFFRHVVNKNAECVAYWQSYGFMNGVLNTDNTSVMGISIDYGPFSFLDRFEPDFSPNHDDVEGRYSFQNQPTVIWWNLVQFAQAIAILIGAGEKHIQTVIQLQHDMKPLSKEVENDIVQRANNIINSAANEYKYTFTTKYAELMSQRLGIELGLKDIKNTQIQKTSSIVQDFCSTIMEPLLDILRRTQIDYNNFFVNLQNFEGPIFADKADINGLNKEYVAIFFNDEQKSKLEKYYADPDNFLDTDSGETRLLVEVFDKVTQWSRIYQDLTPNRKESLEISKKVNPLFTPRSWIFDEVIDHFVDQQRTELNDPEADIDTSPLRKLHLMSSNPYDPSKWDETLRPDLKEKWSQTSHSDLANDKFMKKASCSS